MNFFKQISSAVDKINSIGNLTHQKNFTNPKPDPLMDLIRTCSYTDEYISPNPASSSPSKSQ